MNFKCPVCNLELIQKSNSYICNNNHVYDLSKHGYVNLHMVNQKRSKVPGDSEDMIKSRNAFLNKDYYKSLSNKLNEMIFNSTSSKSEILDVGCGVGYYLSKLKESCDTNKIFNLYGIDISKSAIQLSAKRKTETKLAVASAYSLPFLDKSFDLLYSVFSPISPSDSARVLKDNGILILVGPAQEHLNGLTKHIYDNIIPHSGNNILEDAEEFECIETIEIKENINVSKEDILDLVKMTPYYWQMREDQVEKLNTLESIETPIHFYIKKYKKKNL